MQAKAIPHAALTQKRKKKGAYSAPLFVLHIATMKTVPLSTGLHACGTPSLTG